MAFGIIVLILVGFVLGLAAAAHPWAIAIGFGAAVVVFASRFLFPVVSDEIVDELVRREP